MAESLRSRTVRGVLWSSVERFSTAGVSFVFGIVLARLLSPSDYGVVAMLAVFMSVSDAFIESGFASALIRKPDRTETDNATAFYFNIVVGLVCYGVLFAAAPLIAAFYRLPLLVPVTRVVALTLLFRSLCVVQQALLTIRLDFKTQAKISLASTIITGGVGIVMACAGWGVWTLVAQGVGGAALRAIMLWGVARWRPRAAFSWVSFRQLFGYGSKMLASGLLDRLYNNAYPIVIGRLFAPATLGIFGRASHFALFPATNTTGVLQRVTFPVLATMQADDARLACNYRRILRMSAFVVFPLMMLMVAIADPFVRFLLGERWAGAVPMLRVLCFSAMWYPIHAINLNLLQVKGRSDLFLRLEICKKVLGVLILCASVPFGIMAMCYGTVVSSVLCLVINTYYTGRLIGVGFVRQMRDLLPTLCLCAAMLGVCFAAQLPVAAWHPVAMLSAALSGGAAYLLLARLIGCAEYQELLAIVRRR